MSDLRCCGLEHHSRALLQSCLLHHLRLPTLPSTPILSQGGYFGGADEELSDGGPLRVIVYGYYGLPMQPVAPPSPDYIPGPEEPQTPPVPQDEDEREPMFIQPHDPDYVPEPMYPEYIPLEDEHVFPAEEQPLPPVVSPTAESPGYVTESDPEEDPEEYEDDETEDGPVDYPMDGGEDGDDDNGDSSRDDSDDEDEDEEDIDEEYEAEDEEEHLALADSAVVVPTDCPDSGFHIPSTRGTIKRLLAMPTPPPSPPISLSPPSAGERLARCTTPAAHSSPSPVPLPLLPSSGCPTQIQTFRIASTQALVVAAPDYGGGGLILLERLRPHSVGLSQAVIIELQTHRDHVTHSPRSQAHQMSSTKLQGTLIHTQHQVAWHAELLALRGRRRRARQPASDARAPDHQDASRDADSHI
ncbi:hypothetical protein Tco_0385534 [Tanacetum coccineum]